MDHGVFPWYGTSLRTSHRDLCPTDSCGEVTPISRKSSAIDGPMLGICCKSVMSALLALLMITFPSSSRNAQLQHGRQRHPYDFPLLPALVVN